MIAQSVNGPKVVPLVDDEADEPSLAVLLGFLALVAVAYPFVRPYFALRSWRERRAYATKG